MRNSVRHAKSVSETHVDPLVANLQMSGLPPMRKAYWLKKDGPSLRRHLSTYHLKTGWEIRLSRFVRSSLNRSVLNISMRFSYDDTRK